MKTFSRALCTAMLCLFYVALSAMFALSIMGYALRKWYNKTFDVTFETLLYSAVVPLKGMDSHVFDSSLKYIAPAAIVCVLFLASIILFDTKILGRLRIVFCVSIRGRSKTLTHFRGFYRSALMFLAAFALAMTLCRIDSSLSFTEYIKKTRMQSDTGFYEKHYVDPDSCNISVRTESGKPKNILLIYVESMETTYASKDEGGAQEDNLIPRLTRLAKENVSFSSNKALGGLHNTFGTGWTLGSIFSSSAGVPFAFPVEGNEMNHMSRFAAGITAIGDILEKQGYTQEFLCGSDADFAGRKDFFLQHGHYSIFDYYTAIEKGYIDRDYYVWWGFEDSILYKIARDELIRLYNEGKPFNLTMLTVDTHHVGGYVCSLCGNNFADKAANVVYCADKQLGKFIDWCKEQEFFRDTVIIITGDHPRMDDCLVAGTPRFDRTVYNCFINADVSANADGQGVKTQNRTATTMDLLPTMLFAAGFAIEGERLALGTNLFSSQPALTEELGYEAFDKGVSGRSSFYIDKFK